jgi:putative ABC transport system ATP-binding protein
LISIRVLLTTRSASAATSALPSNAGPEQHNRGFDFRRNVSNPPGAEVDEHDQMAFRFEQVTVIRAGRRILDEVSAAIPATGITVVLGASGSGKTTLLRLCNRLELPDTGTVHHHGQRLDDLDPLRLRRQVGMVFQRATPFPGSVRDNLAVAQPTADTEAMTTALKRASLAPDLLDRDARTMSGGELQRMCLARTLITEPDTLLLDEPTSALDEGPKRAFEDTARGITILWVTHEHPQSTGSPTASCTCTRATSPPPDGPHEHHCELGRPGHLPATGRRDRRDLPLAGTAAGTADPAGRRPRPGFEVHRRTHRTRGCPHY